MTDWIDPLGPQNFTGGFNSNLAHKATQGFFGPFAKPGWWDNKVMGNYGKWMGPRMPGYWNQGGQGAGQQWWNSQLNNVRTKAIQRSFNPTALAGMTQDTNSPFYGINAASAPNWLLRAMNYAQSPYTGIKDPMVGVTLGQLGRAVTAPDLISANDVRNQTLDQRANINADWTNTQRQMEDSAAGRGIADSGIYGRTLGEGLANRDASVKAAALENAQSAAGTNYQYKQGLLENALNQITALMQMKRGKNRQRMAWLNQLNAMGNQARAQQQAGMYSAIGGLAGSIGNIYGSGTGG